jgi:hypothetical protein
MRKGGADSAGTRAERTRMGVARFVHKDHDALVTEAVLSSGLGHECSASWATGASRAAIESAHSGWTIAAALVADAGEFAATSTAIARDTAQNLLVAEWRNDRVSCRVLARTSAQAAALLESVRRLLPASADSEEDDVRVTFWSHSDRHAERVTRRITVPTWASARANYHSGTRAQLDALTQRLPDIASGKLILWHGPPGTGKTWAVRALLREWKGWADAHYILDPEKFFGQSAGYMMSVILDQDSDADESSAAREKWRLLIVEDAAELVGADARLETGQGLARLLNVCDGLVGQGLRVLILLTTNEDVGRMHPAVTRRGRCIANIRFDLLSPQEIQEWGVAHGVTTDGERSALLADLFAADQILTSRPEAVTGFRPRGRPV